MSDWDASDGPAALRDRARWYRDFATICGGNNAWCLRLAGYFERLAEERDARVAASERPPTSVA